QSPETSVSELELLTAAERNDLLSQHGTASPSVHGGCIHEALSARGIESPKASALVAGDETWSYEDLEWHSSRIAAHLRRCGVRPGDRIGVLLERSPRLIASILGLLKAGAVCVPLDSGHPPERMLTALEDSSATALLVGARTRSRLQHKLEI